MSIVTFTGHRPNHSGNHQDDLRKLEERMVQEGVNFEEDYFKVGGAPGFDSVALELLLNLKVDSKRVIVMVPFLGFERYATRDESINSVATRLISRARERDIEIREICNGYGLSYGQKCYKRNQALVDKSDIIFTNWNGAPKGGTFNTVTLAKRFGLTVVNITE